jgi:GTP:adenosylcobinamide-phosphate guanylyltransferase
MDSRRQHFNAPDHRGDRRESLQELPYLRESLVTTRQWNAIILAAGRGPADPMAKAFKVLNKCAIEVAGVPMLARVASALQEADAIASTLISIEDRSIATTILGQQAATIASAGSAPGSVIAAVEQEAIAFPILITTADHALLTAPMVDYFCRSAEESTADFVAALATADTVLAAYPRSIRTFVRLGKTRVTGCNLYALRNERGLKLLARWQHLESARKKPWRLVAAFGLIPLLRFLTGTLDLPATLAIFSRKLAVQVGAVFMPFPEAAIDVDKPADKELAEEILKNRSR